MNEKKATIVVIIIIIIIIIAMSLGGSTGEFPQLVTTGSSQVVG